MEESEFSDIRPYSDEEAMAALARISRHPFIFIMSKYLFPSQSFNYLSKTLRQQKTIEEFQSTVVMRAIESVLDNTTKGFSVSGVENITELGRRFLAVSNHRDIVLDPAVLQYTMCHAGLTFTEICVGSNLLKNQLIEDLMRSNRMIKVIRGIGARQLYLSSQLLSRYIRQTITSGNGSVWIAQREGRAKNGLDVTEQGLLKMFDMSGTGTFEENFNELCIIPLSISYEYEPCDYLKARELLIRAQTGSYTKKSREDTHSILTGIRQKKGHVHLTVGQPLTPEEIAQAASFSGNDRYQEIRRLLDRRIISGYRLWKTNYMGYDLMNGTREYLGVKYTAADIVAFKAYADRRIGKIDPKLNRTDLYRIFYEIYGNPVKSAKEILG